MLKSLRCLFTPIEEADFAEIMAMYAEKDSNKYIRPLRERNPESYPDFLRLKIRQFAEGSGYFWTLRDFEGNFLGTANFNYFEPLQVKHCGVHLSRRVWGKGYATEIIHELKKVAAAQGETELHALVEVGNIASMVMLEKNGFQWSIEQEVNGDTLRIYNCKLV